MSGSPNIMSRNCTSHKWLYVLIGIKVASVSFKFWCILDLVILQCRKHSNCMKRQETSHAANIIPDMTLARHTDSPRVLNIFSKQHRPESRRNTKSLFSQTGKGISGQWPLPSPGCSIKGYRPTPKKIASGYCSHVAPGKGRRMLLRTVHLSMGLSCGTIVFLHQLLEGLNCQGHGTSKITCGTSNLVFESCENLHVALSQNVEKNHGSIPLKWPSKSIKQ